MHTQDTNQICRLLVLRVLLRVCTSIYEYIRVYTSIYEYVRVFTSMYEYTQPRGFARVDIMAVERSYSSAFRAALCVCILQMQRLAFASPTDMFSSHQNFPQKLHLNHRTHGLWLTRESLVNDNSMMKSVSVTSSTLYSVAFSNRTITSLIPPQN